jgi:hypothetical protein
MPAVASRLLWPVRAIGALLPDGWPGFARQVAVFVPFDIAYELSRAFAQGGEDTAIRHAREVASGEQSLGIYQEHAVQDWALSAPGFVMDVAKFTYFQCQFTVTFAFVIWVYIWRHEAYTLLRNALFATFMLAVPGYIFYPTAPPRLLQEEHFIDPLRDAALNQQGTLVSLFGNPYAAMPSLHTATAILVGACGVLVARHTAVRVAWALYPALVVFSIVATANHFFLDAIAGAGVLVVALAIVLHLHRRNGWSLAPLRAVGDRSPAVSDRLSRRRAGAVDGLRSSDR